MKDRDDHDVCPYALRFSDEENEALEWLEGVLFEIASGRKQNSKRARLVIQAIKRAFDRGTDLHNRLHEIEVFSEVMREDVDRVMN